MPELLAAKFRGSKSNFLGQSALRTLCISESPAPAINPTEWISMKHCSLT